MQIQFQSISKDYMFPLSKQDIRKFISNQNLEDLGIGKITFGYNKKTTQEGRTVQRGDVFDIRINFCVDIHCRSKLLMTTKSYLRDIELFGGQVNLKEKIITWDRVGVKKYTLFILCHEIAHIIYANQNGINFDIKSSKKEERWCDDYAIKTVKKYYIK